MTSNADIYFCETNAWSEVSPDSIETGRNEERQIVVDSDQGWKLVSDSGSNTEFQGHCRTDGSILSCETGVTIRVSSDNDDPYFEGHLSINLATLQFVGLTHYFGSRVVVRSGSCIAT